MSTDRKWHETVEIFDARHAFFVFTIKLLRPNLRGLIPLRRIPVDRPEVYGQQRIDRHLTAANNYWFITRRANVVTIDEPKFL